eukprot:TRINITY_DN9198_c0_g1_i2.p4 TRINITY_DN9198_c0_g1~~TRINITY_DN9198_c0_g1_i2.p4  ORF type:complete len:114 (+),score=26.31 TRINITY_DN9198_c0_g1_i2:287-628(+)
MSPTVDKFITVLEEKATDPDEFPAKGWRPPFTGKWDDEGRFLIRCPFKEKEDCWLLGGKWCPERHSWCVPSCPGYIRDLSAFDRWIPAEPMPAEGKKLEVYEVTRLQPGPCPP